MRKNRKGKGTDQVEQWIFTLAFLTISRYRDITRSMQLKYVTFLDYACRLIRNLPITLFEPVFQISHWHDDIKYACTSRIRPSENQVSRRRCEVVKISVQRRIREECCSRLIRCLEKRRWVARDTLPIERFITPFKCLSLVSPSQGKKLPCDDAPCSPNQL